MATFHSETIKKEKLNMRINSEDRAFIDRAAKIRGKNRSEFILNAARREAEEVILEQTAIKISLETYTAFLQRLDQAPSLNQRLMKTMQTKAVWEK
jgi:uncharacterized protein (DUF1778 family)